MIRPAAFGFNEETAVNNAFQHHTSLAIDTIQQQVLQEFDSMVNILREHKIDVIVMDDDLNPPKPDAVFPNNWISTSPSGIVSLFPMFAPNRRPEKRHDIVKWLATNFVMNDLHDWSEFEAEGRFLEGTGSMVIDHEHKMIYASVSERTSVPVLE